jgi:Zn-dependent membrane protease YugP
LVQICIVSGNFKHEVNIKQNRMSYLILAGAIMLASWAVSSRLKSKFEQYSKMQLQNGMSGAEIAEDAG